MEQRVINTLHQQYGVQKTTAKQYIRKAQTYYGWKLREGDLEQSIMWVLEGVDKYDQQIGVPLPAIMPSQSTNSKVKQLRKNIIQAIQTLFDKSPIEAEYMVKYVEDRFGKLKNVPFQAGWDYIFKRFNENEFIDYAVDRPDYYQFLFTINQGNKTKSATQQQLQKLKQHQQLYQTYKHAKKSKQQQQTQKDCSICMSEFESDDKIIQLQCKHIFHSDCIIQWLKEKRICPNCKKPINTPQK